MKRAHYKDNKIIKYLFPLSLLILTYNNLVHIFGASISHQGAIACSVFVLQPIVVPILLLLTFEITYVLHKRRSVNFCGIQFDEGRRRKLKFKDWVLRNLVRIISTALVVIGLITNFALVSGGGGAIDGAKAANSVGWMYVFEDGAGGANTGTIAQNVRAFMSLIPVSILVVANVYFAFVMWLYGSNSSMVIHSSYFNPWMSQLIGTLALAVTQIVGTAQVYPLTSALGNVILVVCILVLMFEVDKDMQAAAEFSDFLGEIAPHNVHPVGKAAPADANKYPGKANGGSARRTNDTMTHEDMVEVKSLEVQL